MTFNIDQIIHSDILRFQIAINKLRWVNIPFDLPSKIHQVVKPSPITFPHLFNEHSQRESSPPRGSPFPRKYLFPPDPES